MAKRLTPYLEASVLALPLADRTYLLGRLQSSLRRDRRASAQERMGYLASKMRDTSGIDVTTPERYAAATWARYIFIYISRQEGYSQKEIGAFLRRDHSTISHAEQRMRDAFALPDGYRDVIEQYNNFIEAIL